MEIIFMDATGSVILSSLRTDLYSRIGDNNSGLFPVAEANKYINTAIRDILILGRFAECKSSPMTTVIGQAEYSCGLIFEPTAVKYDTASWLDYSSLSDMKGDAGWRDATGVPTKWIRSSGAKIYLNPIPTSVKALVIYGYGVSAELLNDGDAVSLLPVGFENMILDRAEVYARSARPRNSANLTLIGEASKRFDALAAALMSAISSENT